MVRRRDLLLVFLEYSLAMELIMDSCRSGEMVSVIVKEASDLNRSELDNRYMIAPQFINEVMVTKIFSF